MAARGRGGARRRNVSLPKSAITPSASTKARRSQMSELRQRHVRREDVKRAAKSFNENWFESTPSKSPEVSYVLQLRLQDVR